MTRLFGLISNDPHALCCSLAFLADDLELNATRKGDGWGIGYYQQKQALIHKHPAVPVGGVDLVSELDRHPSDLVVAHVRSATMGRPKLENTHPFKYSRFLFAHMGSIPELEQYREEHIKTLPDYLARVIRGDTDSELLFVMLLAGIKDVCGGLEEERLKGSCIRNAVRAVFSDLKQKSPGNNISSAIVLADGARLVGVSVGNEKMYYRLVENVPSCDRCRRRGKPEMLYHVRFITVAVGLEGEPRGWLKLKPGQILMAERDMGIEIGTL
ncbi:MAG: class II glutamine amidotransferase [Deltaproteobacteria bacterium]|nr:class II glutamine amidotransferase [Deltaproteobacteria bacterium]